MNQTQTVQIEQLNKTTMNVNHEFSKHMADTMPPVTQTYDIMI